MILIHAPVRAVDSNSCCTNTTNINPDIAPTSYNSATNTKCGIVKDHIIKHGIVEYRPETRVNHNTNYGFVDINGGVSQ